MNYWEGTEFLSLGLEKGMKVQNTLCFICMCAMGIFFSCKVSESASRQVDPDLVIELQKTGCLGPCPVYTLSVYEDRSVVFRSKANTLVDSTARTVVSEEAYQNLINAFRDLKFHDLDSSYIEPIMDAPSTHLAYGVDKPLKKVTCRGDAPARFDELARKTEEIAVDAGWLLRKNQSGEILRELIVDLVPMADPNDLVNQYEEFNLELVKKIAPSGSYYLFTLDTDNPSAALQKIKESALVKKAQWNHKLKKR